MSTEPAWSISIICKNEEDSIPRLLDSMKTFIESKGEVVILDTGSTDNTIQILINRGFVSGVENPNAKLKYYEEKNRFLFEIDDEMRDKIHQKFLVNSDPPFVNVGKKIFDFGAARRYAASLCSNDWILSIDCDEVFVTMLISVINYTILTDNFDQFSFVFKYKGPDGDTKCTTMRDKFYDRRVCDWKWVVHEQAVALPGKKSRMATFQSNILSIDHFQHPAEHRSDYLTQMCIDVLKYPENDRHTHWLGREMCFAGLWNSSIKLLKWHIKNPLFNHASSGEKCMSCIYIGDCYFSIAQKITDKITQDNTMKKSLSWYTRGTFYEKSFREPWLRIAQIYHQQNDHLRAVQFAQASTVIKTNPNTYMNHALCYGSKPYEIIYWGLYHLNRKEEAYEAWKKARELSPESLKIKYDGSLFAQFTK